MKILFLNNDGAGFADYVDVQEGTTIEQFIASRFPHPSPRPRPRDDSEGDGTGDTLKDGATSEGGGGMTSGGGGGVMIRVNRQPVPRDYVLQAGDRVTATPTKIEGAFARRRCVTH